MEANLIYTGTTKGFEHYYGKIIIAGQIEFNYRYSPRRNKCSGVYHTREFVNTKEFGNKQIVAYSLDTLMDRVLKYCF